MIEVNVSISSSIMVPPKREKVSATQKPTPVNPRLYAQAKEAYAHLPHSAYRSGLIVKKYKALGGKYRGTKTSTQGLTRWFQEKWRNQKGQVGYQARGDVYRPTKRITKETPVTLSELSPQQLRKAQAEKKKTGHVKRFQVKDKPKPQSRRQRASTKSSMKTTSKK